jgi:hypothetical protein
MRQQSTLVTRQKAEVESTDLLLNRYEKSSPGHGVVVRSRVESAIKLTIDAAKSLVL